MGTTLSAIYHQPQELKPRHLVNDRDQNGEKHHRLGASRRLKEFQISPSCISKGSFTNLGMV